MSLLGTPLGFRPSGIGPEEGRRLVVVLHGWLGTPKKMDEVVQAARDAYPRDRPLCATAGLWEIFPNYTCREDRQRATHGNGRDLR